MMVPAQHPLVRKLRSRNLRDHVIHRLDIPVGKHLQVYFRRPRPHVITQRQRSAPFFGSIRPRDRRQQRLRIRIRNRQNRDLLDHRRIFNRQTLRIFRGAHSGSQWISRIIRVLYAPALYAVLGTERSFRKYVSLGVSIIFRIGIDQAANRAMLRRNFRFDPTPPAAIACDDDRTLHRHTHAMEFLVILPHAVIDIDQRSCHISIRRICVVGRQLFLLLVRRRIHRHHRLLQLRHELCRSDQFHQSFFRSRKQHVELLDVRIQPPLLELRQDPLRVVLVVR